MTVNMSVVFPIENGTRQNTTIVRIYIMDDYKFEDTEYFYGLLTPHGSLFNITTPKVIIYITNDDGMWQWYQN